MGRCKKNDNCNSKIKNSVKTHNEKEKKANELDNIIGKII